VIVEGRAISYGTVVHVRPMNAIAAVPPISTNEITDCAPARYRNIASVAGKPSSPGKNREKAIGTAKMTERTSDQA